MSTFNSFCSLLIACSLSVNCIIWVLSDDYTASKSFSVPLTVIAYASLKKIFEEDK
jgi:hypothetical protein